MTRSSTGFLAVTPVVAALALAGCGSDRSDTGASPSARTSTPSAASPSPAPRQAADGTRLSACEDGTCEVNVTGATRIPVARKSGIASLKVRSISSGEISLTAVAVSTPTGYEFNSSCGGGSCSTSVDNDRADITAHAGAEITLNRLVIQVASLSGGSAVLRLSPA